MSDYDVAQICLNGHVTKEFGRSDLVSVQEHHGPIRGDLDIDHQVLPLAS